MKDCFENLNRIEFVITYACTGNCKHCSEGEHKREGVHIDSKKAVEMINAFVKELHRLGVRTRMQPAWLVDKENDNPYNIKTGEILEKFKTEGIEENEGNVILPSGNARKYLSEYFDLNKEYKSPYAVDTYDIDTISVKPDGTLLGGNIYEQDILDIMDTYRKSLSIPIY